MAVGIIAEYNPFHNGHEYHILRTRELYPDEPVVCVMSGNFVQRGEAALFDKQLRARAAVECGADLVAELPVPWATSSAEGFARGATAILSALGCDKISFGSESGDSEALLRLANILGGEKIQYLIRNYTSEGMSYSQARQDSAQLLAPDEAKLLTGANDMLAAEYLAAAIKAGYSMLPVAVKRRGAEHDGKEAYNGFASASYIREKYLAGQEWECYVPDTAARLYAAADREGGIPENRDNLETALLALLRCVPEENFDMLPGAEEGFGKRLIKYARECPSLSELYRSCATRRYLYSRVRRMCLWAALGITAQDAGGIPPYARILAIGERGREVLRAAAGAIPVITKPAHIERLNSRANRIFSLESRADDIYALAYSDSNLRRGGNEMRMGPYIKPEIRG